jgi:multiple sugar transport system permease protein
MLKKLTPFALIAPGQVLLLVLIGLPAIYVLVISFTRSTFGLESTFVGFANYATVLADPNFWRAFVNTLVVVNVVVYGELLLALAAAFLFASGVPLRRLMFAIMLAPYAVSPVVAVVIWRFLAEPDVGLLTQTLQSVGLPTLNWATERWHALGLVSVLSIWIHLPFTFVILYAAVQGVPKELYEAARIDGASGWDLFKHVSIPWITPAIFVALLFRFVFAFRLFTEVWLLTRGGPVRRTEVLATYLYREGFRYHDFGTAAATGWLMLLASLALAAFYIYRLTRSMRANHG